MSGLTRTIIRHDNSRECRAKLSNPESEQKEILFSIIEAPDPPRGKRGKFYEVRKTNKSPEPETPEPKKEKGYAFSVPENMELCPYIRNVIERADGKYDGTCALTKEQCLGHKAYSIGKDPNCKPYNTVWHPQSSEMAAAIRNASAQDLVAFMDRSAIS